MATDATGTPTSPDNIPTFNTAVDAPSGLGGNAQMAAIQTALNNRVTTPGGILNGQGLRWNGTSWVAVTLSPPTRQILSGSGTYTTPSGVQAILVECIGPGGAGGGAVGTNASSVAIGQGGQAGGYAAKLIASPLATYSYVVGTGGVGGAGINGGSGSAATTFGTGPLLSAAAGAGGVQTSTASFTSVTANPPAGNVGTIGDILIAGGVGTAAIAFSLTQAIAGNGGSGPGPYGGGGGGGTSGASTVGGNASNYGGGGGGACNLASNATARAGGNGGNGIIVVTEFYF